MKESIVLYPAPAFHHMVSMVELGKLMLQHKPYFSITILITTMTVDTASTSSYIKQISQTNNSLSFFPLPSITLPQSLTQTRSTASLEFIRYNAPNVVDAITTISLTSKVLALITTAVFDSYHPKIPTYYYVTTCASALALILYLPTLHKQTTTSFKDMDNNTLLHIPGLPPIKPSQMPDPLLDTENPVYSYFLNVAECLSKSKGIIINTFDSIEARPLKALNDGTCVPNGIIPPIYSIGPLVVEAKDRNFGIKGQDPSLCLTWLDAQQPKNVVFLCFGSRGTLSELQIKETAIGLERSNHKFLWVVKNPIDTNKEPNFEELLPKGFLERTKDRGLVVKSWAPQATILSHESIGGFVTHCGWNSILEAMTCGVPMIAWPLHAEQRMNSVVLVEDMKIAIPIEKQSSSSSLSLSLSKEELVMAEEVENRVKELMDSESEKGNSLRQISLTVKAVAKQAWTNGGTSLVSFSKMMSSWKQEM